MRAGRRLSSMDSRLMVAAPTTKRKPLTKLQRAEMFARHNGICVICGLRIVPGQKFIDEHIRALGLLGTNDMSNRGPAHITCAAIKTHDEDMPRIVKAKAQAAAGVGRDPRAPSNLRSAGFPKKPPREPKAKLPPRMIYV